MSEHFDVLIVGAGISGIGAAYHLQQSCPGKRYAILERRGQLGGTWDLFRYPGIRSDSDMHTLGYRFRPWRGDKPLADGPAILEYLDATARENGIDRHIRFGQSVLSARWDGRACRWHIGVRDEQSGEERELTCSFFWPCAGYYNYDQGYTPDFEGVEDFKGTLVHPQHWPEELDYSGKRVVVIGSGATAITLVPAMAGTAGHVTMLQRSPSYVMPLPEVDEVKAWLGERLSPDMTYKLVRWKNIALSQTLYFYSRFRPDSAKSMILDTARKMLGEDYDVDTHFNPHYKPWDQRLCIAPGGDLFKVIRAGQASVVTDHIERFTETGLQLRSGEQLEADIIVTATGLNLQFCGGIELEVDGRTIVPSQTLAYHGMMLGEVPNFALCIGYINASWTLKVDLTCEYVCRMLNHMDEQGYTVCTPRPKPGDHTDDPLMDFSAGYILRNRDILPRQGKEPPWRVRQNYLLDSVTMRRASFPDPALEFDRRRPQPAAKPASQRKSA